MWLARRARRGPHGMSSIAARPGFPCLDTADVFCLHWFYFPKRFLAVVVQRLVKRIADDDFTRSRDGHQSRRDVDAVADSPDVRAAEWPQGHHLEIADGDADVQAARG